MRKLFVIVSLLGIMLATQLAAEELTGRDIMQRVDEREDGDDRHSNIEMILENKNGRTRSRYISSYSKDYGKDTKSVMVFLKPADVKGTGFLSWEYDDESKDDDRWLYMPALRKVRRISGTSKNDYFMGSDFTYDDMGDRNIDEDTHELLQEEKYNGHDCWVVQSTPKKDDENYTFRISKIRKDINMAIYVEYYNDMGLMKKLQIEDVRQVNTIWTIHKMIMDNLEKNHKTYLNISNVQYNQNLDDSMFQVSAIERGRIR